MHTWHASPVPPQAVGRLPSWQTPAASQQPAQFEAVQLPWDWGGGVHAAPSETARKIERVWRMASGEPPRPGAVRNQSSGHRVTGLEPGVRGAGKAAM